MPRIFSGIQPSGELHIGNYLGAVKNWVQLQHEIESFICIVDYHAITQPYEPEDLRRRTYEMGVSLMAAGIGVVVSVAAACVSRWLRPLHAQALYFLSVLPAAVPGMVLGLGYLLLFNDPANPLGFLYGTLLVLALCNVYHYHAQGYLIASTSVGQVSRVFDETSTCLGGTTMRTLRSVILPLIAPSVASIGVFYFVRSMVTLSAVIFLVTPATQLAAVSVLLLDDSGNQNQAAAFSVCIMLIVAAALGAFRLLQGLAPRFRKGAAGR